MFLKTAASHKLQAASKIQPKAVRLKLKANTTFKSLYQLRQPYQPALSLILTLFTKKLLIQKKLYLYPTLGVSIRD